MADNIENMNAGNPADGPAAGGSNGTAQNEQNEMKSGERVDELEKALDAAEKEKQMLNALCINYTAAYYCDLMNDYMEPVKSSSFSHSARESSKLGDPTSYSQWIDHVCSGVVVDDMADEYREVFDAENLMHRLMKEESFTYRHRTVPNGAGMEYFEATVVRLYYDKHHFNVIMGYRPIDDLVEEERRNHEKLEAALLAAQHANNAKTTFLNNMSHDIRTPMNAIIGFTSLAASHINDTEKVKEYLSKISTSSEHLLSLINDVLDMSRIESGKVKIQEKPLHLPDLMHDIRTIVQPNIASKQLDFLIDMIDVRDEDIVADKLRLNQILLNILNNGIKFNRTGGMISLRIKQTKQAPKGYANYQFIVRDTGVGMSPEFTKHIFEAFSREETSTVSGVQGTGLGMTITKNIVDMMGGTIDIKSEEGLGSEFTVSLTFKLSGESVAYEKIEQLQGLRALVADDDTDTCLNISNMLTEIGMRPEWTVSGKEAIIRSKQAFDIGDEFSVYIIDWLMPDMNGIETVRRIRRVIGNDKPIIILTAYDWTEIEDEAKEAGVTAFCEKPLFMSELRDILSKPFVANSDDSDGDQRHDFEGKKVLLVEDNELNAEIAGTILTDAGFDVDTAQDGAVAVEKVRDSEPGRYDLVLMDIQMPNMNGYEAARAIRAMSAERPDIADLPVIAMTANAFEEDRIKSLEAGMNGHLAKPVKITELMNMISGFLL